MPRVVLHHATRAQFDTFDFSKTVDGGVHGGTEAQARMRGGKSARLIAFEVDINHPRRCRDEGGNWAKRIKQARAAGHDAIVYLNRYEGIPAARVDQAIADGVDLDALSDSAFKKRVPEAEDSYIILHPQDIYLVKPPALPVLPRATLDRVVHIGHLDPADKGWQGASHEGAGLSFSTNPEAWERIANLGDRPHWEAQATDWRLLDGHACLNDPAHRDTVMAWAQQAGLVDTHTVFEARYWDDELDSLVTLPCATEEAAWGEVENKEEEPTTAVVPVSQAVPTATLCRQMAQPAHVANRPHALTEQWAATAWAQANGWDGVWWADQLAPAKLSAPRGVLFPASVKREDWSPVKSPVAPSAEPVEKPRRRRSP